MSLPLHAAQLVAVATPMAFDVAYREYAQLVARWARQLGGAGVDVEDVVQDVFVVVSRKLAGFRGEAQLTSWLFEITRKTAANHRRQQRWRFWQRSSQTSAASLTSQSGDPLTELERRQRAELFYAALDRLPEKYRTVLVLFEIEGLTTLAIAQLCRLNPATVKVQLHRARELFLARYERLRKKGQS